PMCSARMRDRFPLHERSHDPASHRRDDVDLTMSAERPRIRTEVQVMFFDTDCGGVVHNLAYLRFIEIARTLLAEQLGLRLTEMAATQRYPVVVRTEIDYRRAAKLGDHLTVEGSLERLDRVR